MTSLGIFVGGDGSLSLVDMSLLLGVMGTPNVTITSYMWLLEEGII